MSMFIWFETIYDVMLERQFGTLGAQGRYECHFQFSRGVNRALCDVAQ